MILPGLTPAGTLAIPDSTATSVIGLPTVAVAGVAVVEMTVGVHPVTGVLG